MNISKNQLDIFRNAFKIANGGTISLPKRIDFEKKNYIEFYRNGMRGGNSTFFLFRENEFGEPFLEFKSSDDFMSWHKIIEHDGNVIELINYKCEIGQVDFSEIKKNLKDGKSINPVNSEEQVAQTNSEQKKEKEVVSRINYWSGFKNLFK